MQRSALQLVVAVCAGATFGAVLTSYTMLRPVRDAIILDKPDDIPWLFLGTFIAVSITSPLWSAILARWSRRRVVPLSYHAFAACLVGFFFAVRAEVPLQTLGHVFYIWNAVFTLFVVSVLWSLLADLLGPETARRLYGPIAAGGTIGTFFGPMLTRLLVKQIGVAYLLLLSALLLELAVIGLAVVRRTAARLPRDASTTLAAAPGAAPDVTPGEHPDEHPGAHPDAPSGGGAFTGIKHVVKSRYLTMIVAYVLLTACAATFLYLRQARIVSEAFRSVGGRTEYFATLDVYLAVVTGALQLFVVRPALGWVGPGIVLAVLPLVQLAGISVLVAAPSLTALMIVQIAARSATHGLTRPARELLFTVVSRDDKYRAKHAIDTIGYRFGDLASAWLSTGLTALAGLWALIVASIPLTAVWIALALFLGAGFRRRVAQRKHGP